MLKKQLKKSNKTRWKFTCAGVKVIAAIFILFFYIALLGAIYAENWGIVLSALSSLILAIVATHLFCDIERRINNLEERMDEIGKRS